MKVLCLVHDDKFIDDLVVTYERLGVTAEFIDLVKTRGEFKYIKNASRVRQVLVGSAEYCNYVRCDGFDYVWVHYATDLKMRFAVACPKVVGIVWSTWGGDYASLLGDCVFESLTLLKWLSAHSVGECVRFVLRAGLSWMHMQNLLLKPHVRSFARRVSFYSTVLPTESVHVERLLNPGVKKIDFHYVRHDYKEAMVTRVSEHKGAHVALVGNSATYSNNTFDALKKLSNEKSICRVICPLSYGDPVCGEQIDRVGRCLYKNRWEPIFRFMPLKDYLNVIGECDVFVFNHIRQQAVGNIQAAIKMGGMVILNDKSPAWRYYKSIGVKVYSIKQLSSGLDKLFEDFNGYREKNIQQLRRFRDMEVYMSEMKATFKVLEKEQKG